jgi:hypothetical protein
MRAKNQPLIEPVREAIRVVAAMGRSRPSKIIHPNASQSSSMEENFLMRHYKRHGRWKLQEGL